MHTRKVRRYFIVPVIYLAVIFGLLFLQFSGTLTVRRSIGDLRFVGTLLSGEDETSREITGARVEYQGLVFEFSEDQPMVIHSEDGSQIRLVPQRFDVEDRRLNVYFSDQSLVRFEVTSMEPSELHIHPTPTNQWPRDGRLMMPYRMAQEAAADPAGSSNAEARTVRYEGREFFFSAPPRTSFEQGQGRLAIPLSGSSRMVRYAEITDQRANVIESAFGDGRRRISRSEYQDAVDEYLDAGYRSWAGSRYNGGSGTWDMRTGGPRFSEEILTAYLAEAWDRNEYTRAFNRMRRAADLHPEQVGLLSSVFLGDLRTVTDRFVAEDQQRAVSLASRMRSGDATVFQEEDLVEFVALRGTPELYRRLIEFSQSVDFRTVELPTAIGMLSAAVDRTHPTPEITQATERFLAIIDDRLLPAIRQFDDAFFVETGQAESELYWSIRAGGLIETVGRRRDNELYRTIGRNLVNSGLRLADDEGFLPQVLLFSDSGIQGSDGRFGPERLYPYMNNNPWYPRFHSLHEQLGVGSFVWSIAQFTEIEIGEEQYRFQLRYPENRTHYILMHGIPPFESMQLFGLQWRNDPRFETYIKGRHYERSTNTLMIKYTDDSTQEEIILFY